ncbi:hypothetical protein ACROYT_G022460 [Oculina patagonica]
MKLAVFFLALLILCSALDFDFEDDIVDVEDVNNLIREGPERSMPKAAKKHAENADDSANTLESRNFVLN